MNLEIKQRVLYLGEKFKLQKNQNPTVRGIASSEGWSKSTVHMDLTKRLEECDKDLLCLDLLTWPENIFLIDYIRLINYYVLYKSQDFNEHKNNALEIIL